MSAEPVVLASAFYWAIYIIALAFAVPVALALLFGVVQTARWFLKGGKGGTGHERRPRRTESSSTNTTGHNDV